ncbi:alpha/beta fold hydrolase [Pseudonocardia sp. CA-107938]|uniref:alpha/beta fold hydrolase n=1 Tax=Pseudonocardia sp. CA-107938 TaxID=3240021 RepID=UPI003D8E0655
MPAVFVHGVPETGALWNGVRAHLTGASVAVELPGFGAPRPAGFGATKDEYAAWLAATLQSIDGPIDLVGHDWGAGLVLRVVSAFDVPLRSWAVDVAAVFAPDYVWHDMAQVWQTRGLGEERMVGMRNGRVAAMMESIGTPPADVATMRAAFDETMGDCILALYRSAVPNPYADWGAQLAGPLRGPGMVVQPTADEYDDEAASTSCAARWGARVTRLDGLGHWWMLEDPGRSAAALTQFWSACGDPAV